ncbi:MAG: PAS domain S-box protein, partial [bacterium]
MERFSNQYVARTVLPWLPVIYAGIGLVYLVAPENGINRETVILSWLTAIAMMSIWVGLWRLPDSRVGALLIGCALVGQSYALSFPFISDDPERFVAFLVTQMGIGCLFYSPLTTLGLGLVGTMGFLGVAATLTSPLGLHWYVDLAATVALSVVVAYFRTVAFESAQKADTEIRLEHTRQRDVFQMALDAVVTADQNGAILDWNAKAEETFGWKREEVVGRLLADTIVPAQHREKHSHGMKRAKEGAPPVVVVEPTKLDHATRVSHRLASALRRKLSVEDLVKNAVAHETKASALQAQADHQTARAGALREAAAALPAALAERETAKETARVA